MQFFDKPRPWIALRGSSGRAESSAELLAKAKRAREARAAERARVAAAVVLQNAVRRSRAVRAIATVLPPEGVVPLVWVAGGLERGPWEIVRVCGRDVRRFVDGAVDDDTGGEWTWMGVGVCVGAAVQAMELGDVEGVAACIDVAVRLARRAGEEERDVLVQWRVCDGLRRVVGVKGVGELVGMVVRGNNTLLRHFGATVLAVHGAADSCGVVGNATFVREVLDAMGDRAGEGLCDSLKPAEVAAVLDNVLVMAKDIWTSGDKHALWSLVAVVSSLVSALPENMKAGDDDDDDDDEDEGATQGDGDVIMADGSVGAVSTRQIMSQLLRSLTGVVSEGTVRALFNAAVCDGRVATVRVCQLFNFLTRREQSLKMAFQNALAFWRPSSSEDASSGHVLQRLWAICCEDPETSSKPNAPTGVGAVVLVPESAPVLLAFSRAYSHLLYIQDADEMLEAKWPFPVDKVREIALTLKEAIFSALYVRHSTASAASASQRTSSVLRSEPGLLDDAARLLSRLYICDSRSPFRTSEDFWLAGRGTLSSDAFVQDGVEAGPQALVQAPSHHTYSGVRQVSYNSRAASVEGAGELLRVAPYLVPFSSRAKMFHSWVAEEKNRSNGGPLFGGMTGRWVDVRRKYLYEDAFSKLNGLGAGLKTTIRVKFIDEHGMEEAGVDGGGVFKEFMFETLRLGFSESLYGMFVATQDGHLYPNPDACVGVENFASQFEFLGRLLGKAVFDGVLVDIPLASFFLSKMLGNFNYPTDLNSLDPELYKNMKFLKNCDPAMVEDLGLNFTVANNAYGAATEVELVKNGRNIPVTGANRIEYMHRVANYRMNIQIREQSDAFLRGFSDVIRPEFIRLFSERELQLLISGKAGRLDLDDLRRNTKYSGGYTEETPVIRWFWQAMSELEGEEQGRMLQFVTSSPRAPLLGFSYLIPSFCIHRAEGEVRLPTASTCMNLLKLPEYKSMDVVREKLRYALHSNAGFDLS